MSAARGIVAASEEDGQFWLFHYRGALNNLPSKDLDGGIWNVVISGASAYSANEPPGSCPSCKAATRSPFCFLVNTCLIYVGLAVDTLNVIIFLPTLSTTPAISSPWFIPFFALACQDSSSGPSYAAAHTGTFQSLGLDPETTTLMRIWLSLGSGIGADSILHSISALARPMTCFIVDMIDAFDDW